jgi:hypothetical protein
MKILDHRQWLKKYGVLLTLATTVSLLFPLAVKGQTEQTAVQIMEQGQLAQTAIASGMDQLWESVLNGGVYTAICQLGVIFAVGSLVFFLVKLGKSLMEDEHWGGMSELIWPLLVAILLANQGAMLRQGVLGLRGMVNDLNGQLLSSLNAQITLQAAYQQVMGEVGAEAQIQALLGQCSAIADIGEQQLCYDQAAQQAQTLANALPQQPSGWFQRMLDGVQSLNLGQAISAPISGVLQVALQGWLLALGIAFQWLVEISLLLTGLVAPLAVGGSLFPIGQKAILGWLTGFFSVGMIKISFNIITGLVATLVLTAEENDPMIFAFATGLISPILALILAGGGGMVTFNALTQAGSVLMIQSFADLKLTGAWFLNKQQKSSQ